MALGRVIRYDPAELRRWLDERRRTPRRPPPAPRLGRPTKEEGVEAARQGITVKELRARRAGGAA